MDVIGNLLQTKVLAFGYTLIIYSPTATSHFTVKIILICKDSQINFCYVSFDGLYNEVFLIIIMKGQILSRIQSYQNIPTANIVTSAKNSNGQSFKLINEVKFYKYITNNGKESKNTSIKHLSPPPKASGQRFYTSGSTLSSNKKINSSNSDHKQVKKSLNFELKAVQKSTDLKNYRIPKRMSQKYLPHYTISKQFMKQSENQANIEQFRSQQSINRNKDVNLELLKEVNRYRRKELMKIYSKYDGNKSAKAIAGSEQNIRNTKDGQSVPRDPELNQTKPINLMMKTINVFKDYKQTPYFNFSHKKFHIKSPQKMGPAKSLNRIPTNMVSEKDDVSIQISGDDLGKDQQIGQIGPLRQILQFGCSEIKETGIDNDSSFLEASQKNMISQIQQMCKKQQIKKRRWKKLPNDFLKA